MYVLRVASRFSPGDTVRTRFGTGVVREARNNGRLLIDVRGRAMVIAESGISAPVANSKPSQARRAALRNGSEPARPTREARSVLVEVDLHGLTVDEALDRAQLALNDALLADVGELRLIHGRSGGRIRAALHRRLGEIPNVRFRLDPRNDGVTIVSL